MAILVSSIAYGPNDCVSLTRSTRGTCLFQTNCENVDTSKFEFSFICKRQEKEVRHTYGAGGFDSEEDYDTEMACDECLAPPVQHALVRASGEEAAANATATEAPAAAATAVLSELPPATASFMGPAGCVAVYKQPQGTCMLQTRCTGQDTATYDFGLTCIERGSPVRHMFGVDSFDPVEKFDTLIKCDHCLALDEAAPVDTPASIVHDVYTLESDMSEVKKDLQQINEHFAATGTGPSTPPESAATEAETEETETQAADADESDDAAADATADATAGTDAPASLLRGSRTAGRTKAMKLAHRPGLPMDAGSVEERKAAWVHWHGLKHLHP